MQTKDVLGARYRLDQRIAVGGMGDVWAARDELLGRRVALKLLHPNLAADDGLRRRFRTEAKAAARLSHPGIVAVYDYGEDPDGTYLAMELVDGEPLSLVIRRRGRLAPTETMSLVSQTASALAAAHAEGLVHRDIKPANLLVRPDGIVKVTDFGIVRAADSPTLTREGTVLGTVAYMSPEQVRGEEIGPMSDIYSLGVVAYECLCGTRPYRGEESIAVALAHLHDPVPPLPTDIPVSVRRLVLRMLQKEAPARPDSAAAVAETARSLLTDRETTLALAGIGELPADEATKDGAVRRDGSTDPKGVSTPTGQLSRDQGSTGALALAGLAEPPTMPLSPVRPVAFRTTTPPRHWSAVAAVVASALVVGVLFAAFPSSPSTRPTVALPQLRGVSLAAAEHRLAAIGVRASTGYEDPSPADVVLAELPAAGSRVPFGATVTLTVRVPVAHHTTPPTSHPAPAPTGAAPKTQQPPGPPPNHGHTPTRPPPGHADTGD
jgi:eukaryotic-like serine/threonine-protein kinase